MKYLVTAIPITWNKMELCIKKKKKKRKTELYLIKSTLAWAFTQLSVLVTVDEDG